MLRLASCSRPALGEKSWTRWLCPVTQLAMRDELCRRFMAIPGVGPVTSLSFKSAIDDPARFRRSRNVAAYFGLTSRRWQSGSSIDVKGRISKAGDPDVRRALYEAASAMLTRFKGRDTIKSWGLKLAKTKCHAKARVAVARKLAIVMHAMWRDGTFYVGDPDRDAHEIDSVNASKLRRPTTCGRSELPRPLPPHTPVSGSSTQTHTERSVPSIT